MLHQVNYRTMLQKAVDIHFDLNYRHLCSSVDDSKPKDNEEKLTEKSKLESNE